MLEACAKYLFLSTLMMLFLSSCSDACEEECINGACIEEGCLCDPGFEGVSCDIIAEDFSGLYYGGSLTYTECNNPAFNETTFADNQLRFCERRGDERYCREVFLDIRANNEYILTIADVFLSPGTQELKIPDTAAGFYTTEGNTITMCATANNVCHTMIKAEDGSELTWTREGPTCKSTYLLIKI